MVRLKKDWCTFVPKGNNSKIIAHACTCIKNDRQVAVGNPWVGCQPLFTKHNQNEKLGLEMDPNLPQESSLNATSTSLCKNHQNKRDSEGIGSTCWPPNKSKTESFRNLGELIDHIKTIHLPRCLITSRRNSNWQVYYQFLAISLTPRGNKHHPDNKTVKKLKLLFLAHIVSVCKRTIPCGS